MTLPHYSFCGTHSLLYTTTACPQCAAQEIATMRLDVQAQTIEVHLEHIQSLSRQLEHLSGRVEALEGRLTTLASRFYGGNGGYDRG
jgi:glutaredoxin